MDLFGLFGEMFNPNKKKPKSDPTYMTLDEVVENYKRQRANNPRPKYWPGKGTYYGDKIYGMEPGDWKQTKPPATRKKIDLSKGKWKWQYTPDDILIRDCRHTEGKDEIKIIVPGLFEISWPFSMKHPDFGYMFDLNRLDKDQRQNFIKYFLDEGIIPLPMEELV